MVSFDEFLRWWQLGLSIDALLDDRVALDLKAKLVHGEASVRASSHDLVELSASMQQQKHDEERNEARGTYHRPRRQSIDENLKTFT